MKKVALIAFLLCVLPSLAFGEDVDKLIRKGERQVQSGKLEAAYSTFQKVLELEPNYGMAINALAQIATFLKRHDEAVFYYSAYLYLEADIMGETEMVKEAIAKQERLVAKPADLIVKTDPPEAEITINGLPMGKGEVSLKVSAGKALKLEASLEDYHPNEAYVTLEETETKEVIVRLKKIIFKGFLKLKTTPSGGVKTYINAKFVGNSVRKLELTEGKHLVCFKKEGFDRWWRYVTVPRKDTVILEAALREQSRPDESCEVMPDEY